jgi:hypothetical protein
VTGGGGKNGAGLDRMLGLTGMRGIVAPDRRPSRLSGEPATTASLDHGVHLGTTRIRVSAAKARAVSQALEAIAPSRRSYAQIGRLAQLRAARASMAYVGKPGCDQLRRRRRSDRRQPF